MSANEAIRVIINHLKKRRLLSMKEIKNQLDAMGYDYAVAIATKAEIENGAACGQLAIICE